MATQDIPMDVTITGKSQRWIALVHEMAEQVVRSITARDPAFVRTYAEEVARREDAALEELADDVHDFLAHIGNLNPTMSRQDLAAEFIDAVRYGRAC